MIVGVLLPLPFNDVFDYKVEGDAVLGEMVRVSFGKEILVGVVWKLGKNSKLDDSKIKPILGRVDFPPLSAELMKFVNFVAAYNMAFQGLVLKMVLSVRGVFDDLKTVTLYKLSGKTLAEAKLKNSDARWRVMDLLRHYPYTRAEIAQGAGVGQAVIKTMIDAGVLEPVVVQSKRDFGTPRGDFAKVKLTDEQQAAADVLYGKVGQGFSVTLIDGVTGSGKTEVYFEAVAKALEDERQVLIMVPEISLTTQWLKSVSASSPPVGIRPWGRGRESTPGRGLSKTAPRSWSGRGRRCFCLMPIWG